MRQDWLKRTAGWGFGIFISVALVYTTEAAQPAKVAPPKYAGVLLTGYTLERRNPLDFFGSDADTLHDVVRTIGKAAKDKGVAGLVVRVEAPQMGLAQAMEIHDALVSFRATGKPVYTTCDSFDIVSYVAVSPSTQIAVPPVSDIDLRGLAFSLYYFKGALDKLGLKADVVHAGEFKDAFDPFLRSEMSAATQEQMTVLLNDIVDVWSDRLSAARSLDKPVARTLLTDGPYTPDEALEKGVVDVIAYPDDFVDAVLGEYGDLDWDYSSRPRPSDQMPSLFSLFAAPPTPKKAIKSQRKSIAVVYLLGPIIDGRADPASPFGAEEVIAAEDAIDLLREAREEENVAAMVLRVNSPGGSAIASDRIWAEVDMIREEGIPVVVSMGDVAASGGYYISAGADAIYAEPTTITGSIGVIGGKIGMRDLYGRIGVTRQTISIGKNADIYSETGEWSGDAQVVLEKQLDAVYTEFLDRVSQGRDLAIDDVRRVAGGRVWSGVTAKGVGLVDEIGGLEAAIAKARELSDARGAAVVEFPRELTPMEYLEQLLSGKLGAQVRTTTPSLTLWQQLAAELSPNLARQVAATMKVMGPEYRVLAYSPLIFMVD
ncbi:signal peptide peptidase SppA [bacterium]|nr:signal peptide peptidase SppA [bacterium]